MDNKLSDSLLCGSDKFTIADATQVLSTAKSVLKRKLQQESCRHSNITLEDWSNSSDCQDVWNFLMNGHWSNHDDEKAIDSVESEQVCVFASLYKEGLNLSRPCSGA